MTYRATDTGGGSATPADLDPPSPTARALIEATSDMIDERGEAAVRVQELVEQVGVSIPVLYRHFGNREGLIQATQLHRLQMDLRAEVERAGAAAAMVDSRDEFIALIDTILERIASPERAAIRWRRLNVLGSTYRRPELAAAVARAQEAALADIAGFFRVPQERGWIRADLDLDAVATLFASQLIGRFIVDQRGPDVDSTAHDELVARAIRHVLFD